MIKFKKYSIFSTNLELKSLIKLKTIKENKNSKQK